MEDAVLPTPAGAHSSGAVFVEAPSREAASAASRVCSVFTWEGAGL